MPAISFYKQVIITGVRAINRFVYSLLCDKLKRDEHHYLIPEAEEKVRKITESFLAPTREEEETLEREERIDTALEEAEHDTEGELIDFREATNRLRNKLLESTSSKRK